MFFVTQIMLPIGELINPSDKNPCNAQARSLKSEGRGFEHLSAFVVLTEKATFAEGLSLAPSEVNQRLSLLLWERCTKALICEI